MRRMGHVNASRRILVLLNVGLVALSAAASGHAAQVVKLHAAFSPDRLGTSTTILIGFTVSTTTGRVPSPLTQVRMSLPKGVNLGTTSLGLATCQPETLEVLGPEGCPPDSIMGLGSAISEVPFGPSVVEETARLTIVMGPATDHHTTMLFYTNAESPVYAQGVFTGQLLPDSGPFGGQLITKIPLTPTLPGGANVSVVSLHTSIGPAGLHYYRREHGRRVAYQPEGIAMPTTCPAGGFPFAASLKFEDGSSASTTNRVACPDPHRASKHRGA